MKSVLFPAACLSAVLFGATACKPEQAAPPAAAATPDPCSDADGALAEAAFVFVKSPQSGGRVTSGFQVSGCSRTFESTVTWKLKARDGTELADGHATGGGADGPEPFSFTVAYTVAERQIGHLEVYEEDASDGEGHPPGRNVIPLVLSP